MTPVQRLTGDLITSRDIGHLKKVGTVMYVSVSSLPIVSIKKESDEKMRENKVRDDDAIVVLSERWGKEVSGGGFKDRVKRTLASPFLTYNILYSFS